MRNKLSKLAYSRLLSQLEKLKHEMMTVAVPEMHLARESSNNEENDQLIVAKQNHQTLETRINTLETLIADSDIVTEVEFDGKVVYGTRVHIQNDETGQEKTLKIVGEMEGMSSSDVSFKSPFGSALLGHEVDDQVEVNLPSSTQIWNILDVRVADGYKSISPRNTSRATQEEEE